MQQQTQAIADLRAELGSAMLAQLSPAEREELGNLNARLQALQPDQDAASQKLLDAKVCSDTARSGKAGHALCCSVAAPGKHCDCWPARCGPEEHLPGQPSSRASSAWCGCCSCSCSKPGISLSLTGEGCVQASHAEVELRLTGHLLKRKEQLQAALEAVDLTQLRQAQSLLCSGQRAAQLSATTSLGRRLGHNMMHCHEGSSSHSPAGVCGLIRPRELLCTLQLVHSLSAACMAAAAVQKCRSRLRVQGYSCYASKHEMASCRAKIAAAEEAEQQAGQQQQTAQDAKTDAETGKKEAAKEAAKLRGEEEQLQETLTREDEHVQVCKASGCLITRVARSRCSRMTCQGGCQVLV